MLFPFTHPAVPRSVSSNSSAGKVVASSSKRRSGAPFEISNTSTVSFTNNNSNNTPYRKEHQLRVAEEIMTEFDAAALGFPPHNPRGSKVEQHNECTGDKRGDNATVQEHISGDADFADWKKQNEIAVFLASKHESLNVFDDDEQEGDEYVSPSRLSRESMLVQCGVRRKPAPSRR